MQFKKIYLLVVVLAALPVFFSNASMPAHAASLTSDQVSAIVSLLQSFGADVSTVANVEASLNGTEPASTTNTPGTASSCTAFDRDLELGDVGDDVQNLQRYLNMHGYVLAQSGPGSVGSETTKFGYATQYQLTQFQKDNSIAPAAGYFGPKTRAIISCAPSTTATAPTDTSGTVPVLTRSLSKGSTGSDVSALQLFLSKLGYLSSDSVTGYFGALTTAAVAKFQKDHGLEAVGSVGPLTRALIATLGPISGSSNGSGTPTTPPYVPGNGYTPGFGGGGGGSVSSGGSSGGDTGGGDTGGGDTTPDTSWILAGAGIDLDFANQRYYSNGIVSNIASLLTTIRTSTESCQWADGHITTAASGALCITDLGLSASPASANEFLNSGDLSASPATTFVSGTGSASISGSAGTAPDSTGSATLITVNRSGTSQFGFGDSAQWISSFAATAGTSSASIYLKAYSSGDAGKKISFILHGATFDVVDITLTNTWTRYTIDSKFLNSSGNTIAVGYTGASANNQNGQTQFLAWGSQAELGSSTTAYIPTTSSTASRDADDVQMGGALQTTLGASAATVSVVTSSGKAAFLAALIGADHSMLLGKTTGNTLTSTVGTTSLSTVGTADWTTVATSTIAFGPSGRSISLNGAAISSDTTAVGATSTAYRIGSVGGSTYFFTGYVKRLTAYDSKLTDNTIGIGPLVSPGTLSTGLAFTGSGNPVVLSSASLRLNTPFSVSMWLKTNSLNGSATTLFLGNEQFSSTGFQMGDNGPFNGGVIFRIDPSTSGGVCGSTMACITRTQVNDNVLHHLVGVYDGSQIKFYLDGILKDTRTATSFTNNSTPYYIGRGLTGYLSDIRLYSRAISATDVSTLYTDGQSQLVPATGDALNVGLVAYWPLSSSTVSATDISDISGNNNTGFFDFTPPNVSITSPATGASVSGTITLTANASDAIGISSVQFANDGVNIGSADTSSPYTASWNSGGTPDGSHTITAVATDLSGNRATSTISVTTSNGVLSNITYYVSPSGDDTNNGTSTSSPWKTVAKVNSSFFLSSSSILFEGGQTFSGCLAFTSSNVSGTASTSPLTISSYGTGTSTIQANCSGAGDNAGLSINGISGVTVRNIKLQGNSGGANYGVYVHAPSNSVSVSDITIRDSDITGFFSTTTSSGISGASDIFIAGFPGGTFNRIYVGHNTIHGSNGPNSYDANGITGFGNGKSIFNALYEYNNIYDIGGLANGSNGAVGNGIVANGVGSGIVQYNLVHDVGGNTNTCGGPAGIWAYNSNNVIFQYNEVYHVRPTHFTAGCDWNAYDLDGSVTNSIYQYNYSHDDYGGGLLFYLAGSSWGPNTARYNLSVNDGADTDITTHVPSITFGGGAVAGSTLYLYNNTSWINRLPGGAAYPAAFTGSFSTIPQNGIVANNLFGIIKDGSNVSHFIDVTGGIPPNFKFYNNQYYSIGGGTLKWATSTVYTSLAAWQAGVAGGDAGAITSDPLVLDGTTDPTCGGYTPTCGAGYKLQSESPSAGTGLNLTQSPYNLSVGSLDYFGTTIPHIHGSGFNIGADGTDASAGLDTTKPTVAISTPADGASVLGSSLGITTTASDTSGIASLVLKIDNAVYGTATTTSPALYTLDTTGQTEGAHTLAAVAQDNAGNIATSTVTIYVSNSAPVISSISTSNVTSGYATINWATDNPATSRISYGTTTGNYTASTTLDASYVASHSLFLPVLSASTQYYYVVVSTDTNGRTSTSSEQTLTTSAGAPFVSDTFTDTTNTLLTAHTPDTGGTWAFQAGFSTSTSIDAANRMYNRGAATSVMRNTATPPSADYYVEADFVKLTSVSNEVEGLTARANAAASTFYRLTWISASNIWALHKFNSGASTLLATSSVTTFANGTTKHVRLIVNGSSIIGAVDGVTVMSATDLSITAAGQAGLTVTGQQTTATGIHIDNFYAGN